MTGKLYFYGGLLVIFLAVLCAALFYRGQAIAARSARDVAQAQTAQAVAVNVAQQNAIEQMTAIRDQNDKIVSDIYSRLQTINERVSNTQKSIQDLAKVNEDVREYLSIQIPDNLRDILNGVDGLPIDPTVDGNKGAGLFGPENPPDPMP